MRNPFAAMALVSAMMRMMGVRKFSADMNVPSHGHNRHSRHRVAMDKRAAIKARNRKRNKA